MTIQCAAAKTFDHDVIRGWIERQGGFPARLARSHARGARRLRHDFPGIDFPGYSDEEPLVRIDWDEFFALFDQHRLALLYEPSGLFSRFVRRDG
jgi:hypothetical protein